MALSRRRLIDMDRYESVEKYSLDGKRVALIICDKSRDGCQHDIKRVLNFCGQNKFKCYETSRFTKAGLMRDLENFRSMLDEDFCCLTVFIMAHGQLGHIHVSDGQVELQRIFEMFDNRRCPALRGNPKLFVIQACRGVQQCAKHPCLDASDLSGVQKDRLWPLESDCFFVYAVCPGKLAIRYPDTGSPLFEEMDKVFSKSTSYELYELFTMPIVQMCSAPLMMTMVNSRLEKRKERVGYKMDRAEVASQVAINLLVPGRDWGRETSASAPVGRLLHIVDRLTKKWYF